MNPLLAQGAVDPSGTVPAPAPAPKPAPKATSTVVPTTLPPSAPVFADKVVGIDVLPYLLIWGGTIIAVVALIFGFNIKKRKKEKDKKDDKKCLNFKKLMEEKLDELTDVKGQLIDMTKDKTLEQIKEITAGSTAGKLLALVEAGEAEYNHLKDLYEKCIADLSIKLDKKILITGVAGTGKSTISKELNKKGITSIDFSDIPDLCFWQNKKTKEKVKINQVEEITWFDSHERICDIQKLKKILDKYKGLVVTGVANGNAPEYFKLFDKILLLQCSPETLIWRMQNRNTLWGKTKVEQDHTLQWQKDFDSDAISKGLTPISTEGNIEDVLNKIISQLSS